MSEPAARAAEVGRLEQERVRLDSRRATLLEMVETRAGFTEGVRSVMERKARGEGFIGVLAPLADLIEVHGIGVSSAVEAALGSLLQAIVVPDLSALPPPEELAALPGRVTFIPMRSTGADVPPARADAGLPDLDAAIAGGRCARSGVRALDRAPEGIDAPLDRLFGRSHLVESLDADAPGCRGAAAAPLRLSDGLVVEPTCVARAASVEGGGLAKSRTELARLEADLGEIGGVAARGRICSPPTRGRRPRRPPLNSSASALSVPRWASRRLAACTPTPLVFPRAASPRTSCRNCRNAARWTDRAELRERASVKGRTRSGRCRRRLERLARDAPVRADAAGEQGTAAKVEVGRLAEQVDAAQREANGPRPGRPGPPGPRTRSALNWRRASRLSGHRGRDGSVESVRGGRALPSGSWPKARSPRPNRETRRRRRSTISAAATLLGVTGTG